MQNLGGFPQQPVVFVKMASQGVERNIVVSILSFRPTIQTNTRGDKWLSGLES